MTAVASKSEEGCFLKAAEEAPVNVMDNSGSRNGVLNGPPVSDDAAVKANVTGESTLKAANETLTNEMEYTASRNEVLNGPPVSAKAAEKAKVKEAKKLKAAQKAEAAKAAQANKAAAEPSKKAQQKAKKGSPTDGEVGPVDPPTPSGEKKRLSAEMAKSYNPKAVEASWYEWWDKSGFFEAATDSKEPPFVIVIPPPNVTGALHIGHALTCAVEDTLIRWRRMSGYNTLWVPGCDHAGIATQVVVEKKIIKERGMTRHDLGRENFVAEVWKWKEQYGGRIMKQLRGIGASVDWSRECFTMDEKRTVAVTEAFVRLHNANLIYRDNRLVNWDCVLRTAVSDIEVDYLDLPGRILQPVPGYDRPVEFGVITSFAYPLEGGEGEVVVATTRLETMLGDTAVAVHPKDERYKHLHGKFVIHPFNNRRIPIICDAELVDMSFGTGAVKITPAHDPNDFATGRRHNLEFINILTEDGRINSNGGKNWESMKRFDARVAVEKSLTEKGLYRGKAENPMRLGVCSRTNDVIEPMIKPQWYVRCDDMAKEACAAVRSGEIEIIPKQWEDTWFRWLENIRDWCISRQLWWGHRIPAWYVTLEDDELSGFGAYNDHWIVGRDIKEATTLAAEKYEGRKYKLEQDPDVLDTWFSSGLFPFSVMGWPDNTADFRTFYPTSLLETGHDILFFWLARMVMLGMKLTGHVPFKQVLLHAMVRDAHGRKMSKSLGNVIDPVDIIKGVTLEELHQTLEGGNLDPKEVAKAKAGQKANFPDGIAECGADALRFSLVAYTAQSLNINLDFKRVLSYRHFCNKIWNATLFAMINWGSDFVPSQKLDVATLPFGCQWILSVLNDTISRTVSSLEASNLSGASTAIYSWFFYQLCDKFIEISKPALAGDDNDPEAAKVKKLTRDTLWVCLDTGLRLLHPIMPFLTEELWQRLPQKKGDKEKSSIVIVSYPAPKTEWESVAVEDEFKLIELVVKSARSLRTTYGLQPTQRCALHLLCRTPDSAAVIAKGCVIVATLATLSSVEVLREGDAPPRNCAVDIVNEEMTAYLVLTGLVDANDEILKLQKKRDEIIRSQEDLAKKMSVAAYSEKAPANVQRDNLVKTDKIRAELETVEQAIENFRRLIL